MMPVMAALKPRYGREKDIFSVQVFVQRVVESVRRKVDGALACKA